MRIHFYGKLSERIGRVIELEVDDACAIANLRRSIGAQFPAAACDIVRPTVRACVDDTVVPESFVVVAGQEVAFLPPLSGG